MFRTTFALEMPTADEIIFNARADFLNNTSDCCLLFPDVESPLDLSVTSHIRYRLQRGSERDSLRDPGCTFQPENRAAFERLKLQLSTTDDFSSHVVEASPHPLWLQQGQLHFEHFAPADQPTKAQALAVPADQDMLSGIYARFVMSRASLDIPSRLVAAAHLNAKP